jgi:hypothetical protein
VFIKIINWSKYNPKSKYKHVSWFRVQSKVIHSRSLLGLSHEEKWVWITLLAMACETNGAEFETDILHIADQSKCKKTAVESVIKHMEKNLAISIHDDAATRARDGVGLYVTERDDTKELAQQVERERFDEFESAWSEYPRKAGKDAAQKTYLKNIKNQADHDLLMLAIENYRQSTIDTLPKFLKYGSSFFNQWKDWVDYKETNKTAQTMQPIDYEKHNADLRAQSKRALTEYLALKQKENPNGFATPNASA